MARWPECTFKTVRATRTLQALAQWGQWKIMPWKKITSKKCNKSNFTLIPCGFKWFLWNCLGSFLPLIVLQDHNPIKDIYCLCAAEHLSLAHCCWLKVVTRANKNPTSSSKKPIYGIARPLAARSCSQDWRRSWPQGANCSRKTQTQRPLQWMHQCLNKGQLSQLLHLPGSLWTPQLNCGLGSSVAFSFPTGEEKELTLRR